MNKKNFIVDDRVYVHSTNSMIDGAIGTILGTGISHIVDSYIVLLDEPLPFNKAILMTEGCLEFYFDEANTGVIACKK